MLFLAAISLFTLTLLVPFQLQAQGKSDFTGNWSLNESKSTLGEGRFRMAAPTVTVSQDGKTLNVERTIVGRNGQERKMKEQYALDGHETTTTLNNSTRKSTCKWSADGKELVISSTMTMERDGQTMQNKSEDTWSLSKDGKVLTIVSKSSNQRGERTITMVYDRK